MTSPITDTDTAQIRLAYPAYKVFIFGVDVSEDVLAVNITSHDGSSPNQCTVSLNNELDKYIMTTNDMLWYKKVDGTKVSLPWMKPNSNPGSTDSTFFDPLNKDRSVLNPTKRAILLKKGAITDSVPLDERTDLAGLPLNTNPISLKYFSSTFSKYPLSDGRPIFHPMDPVRVFYRDPFNPSRWYHMFCGFVSDMVDTATENNAKILSITIEDPTKLLRYQRVFINPGILDAHAVVQKDGDVVLQSFWTNKFPDYTLPEVMFTLLFGYDYARDQVLEKVAPPLRQPSSQEKQARRTLFSGVGHFSWDISAVATIGGPAPAGSAQAQHEKEDDIFGGSIVLTAGDRSVPVFHLGDKLEQWQLLLDHEVQPSDMYMMATPDDRNRPAELIARKDAVSILDEVDIDLMINYIGTNPDKYPVDGGRLMMLMPRSLGVHNNSILLKDIIQSYPMNNDGTTFGAIITETLNRLEFSMYCSPRGDIVMEMPLYDFDPDKFGVNEITSDSVESVINSIGGSKYLPMVNAINYFGSGTNRGPYCSNYVITKTDTMAWDNAHVDQKVFTVAVAKRALFQNWDNLPFSDITGELELARRESLIPLYGYRAAPVTPRGYITTKSGSKLYAELCLNRLNADAHTIQVTHVPNIKLWLNRPIYIQGRNTIATTKAISHSITWGAQGDMTTTSDLYAGRTWDGDMSKTDPTRPVFTSINGYDTSVMNYAVLFNVAPQPPTNFVELTDSSAKASDAVTDDIFSLNGLIKPVGQ
jgi:hypothetical protein